MTQRSDGDAPTDCAGDHEHGDSLPGTARPDLAFQRAVEIFKALGDEARLRTLEMLARVDEACVSELASTFDESVSTVSHRLRLLRSAGLVQRRRSGKHVYYRLADHHVAHLVRDALDHATEG